MNCDKHTFPIARLTTQPIEIAIDTEYQGTSTLTVQLAAFVDEQTVVAKVYRSREVPKPPKNLDLKRQFASITQGSNAKFKHLVCRPTSPIDAELSPAIFLRDILDLQTLEIIPRRDGLNWQYDHGGLGNFVNATWSPTKRRWKIPRILITLIGHFLPADFGRIFGTAFTSDLLAPRNDGPRPLEMSCSKVVGFVERHSTFRRQSPTVQFIAIGDQVFQLDLGFFDTSLSFGSASLDSHCRTFLGSDKMSDFTQNEKDNMLSTFRKRTADAYRYAIGDSVRTLLVHREMKNLDARLYTEFGIPAEGIPRLCSTQGRRVANFLVETTAHSVAAGSALLQNRSELRELLSRGGSESLDASGASRYGNVGTIHGGLVISRSPTTFWHACAGMLSDVDFSACYSTICKGLNVNWGQPIVFEPGSKPLTLQEAVQFAQKAADPDSWLIRVTGNIANTFNALIPSTLGALTSANYASELKRRRRLARAGKAISDPRQARLFSKRVAAGVVTSATWLMIESLPAEFRDEYRNLIAETIIFYPRQLVARTGIEYDQLVERRSSDTLPWWTDLDLDRLVKTEEVTLNNDFVSLRFPIGKVASKLIALRKAAQQESGKVSGADKMFKEQANTMYGALSSPFLPTNNIVAANQVTGTARALAFALVQSLNGLQVNTDGATFRRDRVPACTFAECLQRQPDYPIRHADLASGIPFLDPSKIPVDDKRFTRWYRAHVEHFFQTAGEGQRSLFAMHRLEHKRAGENKSPVFDALATDGCSNYIQCDRANEGTWRPRHVALRSYQAKFTSELVEWLIATYSQDRISELPPLVEVEQLLKALRAFQQCKKAFRSGRDVVRYPIGLTLGNVLSYSAIKASAFIYQDERQALAIEKQFKKFQDRHGCGLEVLAMRRGYKGRRQGSMNDLAVQILELVNAGKTDLTKVLNLIRTSKEIEAIAGERADKRDARRIAKERAFSNLLTPGHNHATQPTGILLRNPDLNPLTALVGVGD